MVGKKEGKNKNKKTENRRGKKKKKKKEGKKKRKAKEQTNVRTGLKNLLLITFTFPAETNLPGGLSSQQKKNDVFYTSEALTAKHVTCNSSIVHHLHRHLPAQRKI